VPETAFRLDERQVAQKSALATKFWHRKWVKFTARLTFPQVRRNSLTVTGLRPPRFSPRRRNRNEFRHRFHPTRAQFIDGALSRR
jgi:hypothetical protein